MVQSVTDIATGIRNAGFKCYANISDQYNLPFFANALAPLTGGSYEFFISVYTDDSLIDSLENGRWTLTTSMLTQSEATGKPNMWKVNTNTASVGRYGLASMLLEWNGLSRICVGLDSYDGTDVWLTEFTTASSLGAPTAATTISNSVRRRTFTGGVVTVNPSETSKTAFSATWPGLSGTITLT
jgi:hypothetical protein